jgi:hypothetical protein
MKARVRFISSRSGGMNRIGGAVASPILINHSAEPAVI